MRENIVVKIGRNRGSAIALVICFVGLLTILIASIIQSTTFQRSAVKKNVGPLQAKLVALSGVHHMLIKAKLMPVELYDAWALAKGRNPLYDFADPTLNPAPPYYLNPGPKFVTNGTVSPDQTTVTIDPADNFSTDAGRGWFTNDVFSGKAWPSISGAAVPNSQLYLWKFFADVNNKPSIQPALIIASTSGDPFTATYEISTFTLLNQKKVGQGYQDTISFAVKGTVIDPWGASYTETLTSIVYITRR